MNVVQMQSTEMQSDLFGPVTRDGIARRRRGIGILRQEKPPVVDGGFFPLKDAIGPDRFRSVFHSGGTAYYDAVGIIEARKDIGVVADLIKPRVLCLLTRYLQDGGKVFADSGAYGQFRKWTQGRVCSPVADFGRVFQVYDDLVKGTLPGARFHLALVMPDVLGHSEWSLELLQQHRGKIRDYITAGVNVIVPLQKGITPAGVTVKRVVEILGTSQVTLGIPSASAAMSLPDIVTIRNHDRFHILGRATMGIPLYRVAYAFLENCPGALVSCDANLIRKSTAAIGNEHSRLKDQRVDEAWEGTFDETELIGDVVMGTDWMSAKHVRALAAFYGVTDSKTANRWVKAHKTGEEGVRHLIEELDPEWGRLWSCGLRSVFGEAALKHLSARLRAEAVASVFEDRPQDVGPQMLLAA